ncbi:MAG: Ig-like domain repeat protein [Terracidiphilus sp.]|jgi:hypothetical protein
MHKSFCFAAVALARIDNRLGSWKGVARTLLCLLPVAGAAAAAAAQTTTISGTVYDPRTTNALPLPNVLVYATTAPVAALPAGVQCLTYQAPTGVVSYAYTAVDGTFTLANIPENATYTVVIQAGKWRRQFPNEEVGANPLTGLVLNMPANQTEGDIPKIAIVTGSVDGVECVLLHMGIASSEFTDDTGSVNPNGRIHLYQGDGNPGAEISASTPAESTLTGNPATLDGYDMVMFPCQGGLFLQAQNPLANLVNYANAGGRVFTTHYSYVYLDPESPIDAQFAPVADWTTTTEKDIDSGVGTIATNFSDGATLAQWLQNAGATVAGSMNQINIGTLRTDVSGVIAPTQSWLTLNSAAYPGETGNPVMQMTFNAPVGAPAANQCGRVMFNDYHVINLPSVSGMVFPSECPAESGMSAQEEMLEYALFDLSTFVQPVVVPTLSVTFNPSPLIVKSGDTADQVTVSVTNTSATTEIASSAILTFNVPQQVTVTGMTDSAGGWTCMVGTLTCIRNGSLAANVTDSVTLTLSVGAYTTLASYAGQLTATVSSVTFSSNVTAQDNVIYQQRPQINWATPAPIVYGTALSAMQLDASSPVAGSFTYSPAAETVLGVGQQTLTATLTPTDTTDYITGTATVTLNVIPAVATVSLSTSANPVFAMNSIAFTASLPAYASTQTGTIAFYDGSTPIGTATIAEGSATITTSALAAGQHLITAAYSGDSDYGPGTSIELTENVQDFTLTFVAGGSSGASVSAGGMASYSLVLTPVNGTTMPAAVNLSAPNIPVGMVPTFSPDAVEAGSGTTVVTLEVALPENAADARSRRLLGGGVLPVALGLILLPFASKVRRGRGGLTGLMVLAALSAALALGMAGCGVKLSPENFSFNVTATSGSLSHTVTAHLTVK